MRKGGGIAKRGEETGGVKVELGDYIIKLWGEIGYVPGKDAELAAALEEHGDEGDTVSQKLGGTFTPAKQNPLISSFGGVSIKHFPKDTDPGSIMEFLIISGLPESKRRMWILSKME